MIEFIVFLSALSTALIVEPRKLGVRNVFLSQFADLLIRSDGNMSSYDKDLFFLPFMTKKEFFVMFFNYS